MCVHVFQVTAVYHVAACVCTCISGDSSISFRRVEALARSHTQTDFKPQSQLQIPAENRRDLTLPMDKDKDRCDCHLHNNIPVEIRSTCCL